MNTGRTVFFSKEEFDEALTPVRASSSLPFVSPIVEYKGYKLLVAAAIAIGAGAALVVPRLLFGV